MTELEKGPRGLRRGRGARERILGASQQLFRDQGINSTGMDQLSAVAEVSKRTLYQHFTGKDELIAEHLRRFDPGILPEGGNDAPVVPPANTQKLNEPVNGTVTLSPTCTKAVAAISRNRALWIGVLQNGVILNYYRSVVPAGAPDNYVPLLLQSLLNQHCQ